MTGRILGMIKYRAFLIANGNAPNIEDTCFCALLEHKMIRKQELSS